MNPPQPHLIYEFGEFELDALRRVLTSCADDQPLQVTGRVFDTLLYMVERAGQLLDKRSLMDALWPNVVVEEGNLTQTIHTLRRVLGERAGEHRYIVTVAGRGYRFVADVKVRAAPQERPLPPESTSVAVPDARSRWHKLVPIAAAATFAVLAGVALLVVRSREQPHDVQSAQVMPSIAVLPFVDMSAQRDQEHFADGVSEEILNLLAHGNALRVIARTSSFSFKDENVDLATIARRLNVTHVLEGSVRKSGDRVRVTAQLIDGATSARIWSQTYDRNVQDIFGMQSEIAGSVAKSLRITLGNSAGPKRAETSSAQAYELYLQGRHLFNRRSGSDVLRAKDYFERAVQIDPGYAHAWAALAGVYFVARAEDLQLHPQADAKWREAAERAVGLAPDLAEANIRAAQYYWLTGNRVIAKQHVARAMAANPSDPLVLGLLLSQALNDGRMEAALALQRRMVATDPLSAINRSNLGVQLMAAGRLEEARLELERALELSPASAQLPAEIARVLILQRRADEALAVIQQMPAGYRREQSLALAYQVRGDVAEGDAALVRLLALAQTSRLDPDVAESIAEVYAVTGHPDQAFKWLDVAHRRSRQEDAIVPGSWGGENLRLSPLLQSLHADPRWRTLLASTEEPASR